MAKVRYFVDDVDAAVSFYIQHLGFELDFNVGPFAMITKDDLTLLISGPKTSAARPMLDGRGVIVKCCVWRRQAATSFSRTPLTNFTCLMTSPRRR